MKRQQKRMILMLILSGLLAGCAAEPQQSDTAVKKEEKEAETEKETVSFAEELPRDYEGTLTMWGWDTAYYQTITEAFRKKYPNVTFEYKSVEHKDTPQKYETALITGGELPDIAWSVIDSRGEVFELDMWEPLEQEPYGFQLSEVYEYLHPHLINSKGDVCGIEQSLSPAGLAYRRDLAKKYLGTDDPQELEAMMPDWESFIQKGKEVYEKSQGKVYMWYGLGDIKQFVQEQSDQAWVEDGKIDVQKNFGRSIEMIGRFRDEKVSDNLVAWTPAWNEALRGDEHIFTACATWSIKFSIESNDPQQKNLGRWGLMSAPEGNANWGGTAMGITKTCKDKRLAWEFLKFATLSTEGARALNSMGLMTIAKKPYEEDPSLKSYKSRWFGDQDLGVYYMEHIIPSIRTRALTLQDGTINDCLSLVLSALNEDPDLTVEESMELLKEELKKELPDLEIQ